MFQTDSSRLQLYYFIYWALYKIDQKTIHSQYGPVLEYVKGLALFNEKYKKVVPFCENGIQKGKKLVLGSEPTSVELCRVPAGSQTRTALYRW